MAVNVKKKKKKTLTRESEKHLSSLVYVATAFVSVPTIPSAIFITHVFRFDFLFEVKIKNLKKFFPFFFKSCLH